MQFQQNQKITISGGTITLTGPVTVGSITNPVTVSNDVVVIIPTFFTAPYPVNSNNPAQPSQAVTGMKLILNATAFTVMQITVSNNTTLDTYTCVVTPVFNTNFPVIIPLAADTGDGVRLQITKISGTGTTVTYNLLGLSQSPVVATPPGSQPLANLEVGGNIFKVTALGGAGTTTLLPTPPTGTYYRLHRVVYAFGGSGVTAVVQGAASTFDYSICQSGASGFANPDIMHGQLVEEGLNFQTSGGGCTSYTTYDLITIPIIN